MQAIAGALLGSGQTFRKYRTVMEIFKMASRNANGGFTGQMVEEEEAQHKVTKINLITDKIDVAVFQKLIPGEPGCFAAGTRFKYIHGFTN